MHLFSPLSKKTAWQHIALWGSGIFLSVGALLGNNAILISHARSLSELAIVTSPSVDVQFPTWAAPNPTQDNTDLTYWINTLPYEQDKTAAGYVVYPKAGVTIPLIRPNPEDAEHIRQGNVFDHYKYLEQGALQYYGAAPDQAVGNMVLAVHSSFPYSDPGRYRTAGQVAPLSEVGDKVFVYLADESAKYTLYIYTIQRSEEIPETAVDILDQNVPVKSLTLFTCYPIGTTDARWVNQAVLTETLSEAAWKKDAATLYAATEPTPTFTTQAVVTEHNAAPVETAPDPVAESVPLVAQGITPTFIERVKYRPVVYRTSLKLISNVGFKRSNLTKLITALDKRIELLSATPKQAQANKKTIVSFMMIKEIIQGFME